MAERYVSSNLHSLIQSFFHLFVTCSFFYSSIPLHSLTHSPARPPACSLVHRLLTHLSTRSLTRSITHSPTHLLTHLFIHSFIYWWLGCHTSYRSIDGPVQIEARTALCINISKTMVYKPWCFLEKKNPVITQYWLVLGIGFSCIFNLLLWWH